MAETISKADIEAKRREVNHAYTTHGFHSMQYQQGFDQLHDMRMDFMAANYRKEWGLPPNATTPYCGGRWSN